MTVIVDYGMGNLGSIQNMLKKVGVASVISSDAAQIAAADKLILPGVGHFDRAMERLNQSNLRALLDRKALQERTPILGICLGMQLLTRSSEEGALSGLGWIPADTKRFAFESTSSLKVPHMGWNSVHPATPSRLTENLGAEPRFYFVHSYYVRVDAAEHSILRATHGNEFDAAIARDNIFGVQFHPEKSHRFGMTLLANFAMV